MTLAAATLVTVALCGCNSSSDAAKTVADQNHTTITSTAAPIATRQTDAATTPPAVAPSAAEYCAVMDRYKARYESQFATANSDVAQSGSGVMQLTGLLYAVMAIGNLSPMWHDMAAVAPPSIKGATDAVTAAWDEQMGNAADNVLHPQMALLQNLAIGLTVLGPMMQVNDFVTQNCN
ncbi:hypothetical protein BKA23_2921 [Rudaeicoccus suwonensis]|uniref:Uncharacterized protein n=2 Tax=Rudaeicoccus suwonensis TaxID=657409 RepID=A0A561E0V6_9MICO|nr:hypothetical protein BKA23_2921 [Rudaeicoccus suwonensis]